MLQRIEGKTTEIAGGRIAELVCGISVGHLVYGEGYKSDYNDKQRNYDRFLNRIAASEYLYKQCLNSPFSN